MPTDKTYNGGPCEECGAPVLVVVRSFDTAQALDVRRQVQSTECTADPLHKSLTDERVQAFNR